MATTMQAPVNQARSARPQDDQEPEAGAETKKKSKKKLLMMVVGLVLLAGVGYMMKPSFFPPHYRPGQPVPDGKMLPLSTNTINLSDGHLVQVGVALQLSLPADDKTITADTPKFLNGEITVFGALTYPILLQPAGREGAQANLLKLFQKIAGTRQGAQQIKAVYFTSFVAQ